MAEQALIVVQGRDEKFSFISPQTGADVLAVFPESVWNRLDTEGRDLCRDVDLPFRIPLLSSCPPADFKKAHPAGTSASCTPEETGYCMPALETRFMFTAHRFSSRGSQSSYHTFLKDMLFDIGTRCGMRFADDRNVCDPSRQTQALLLPDLLLWVSEVLLLLQVRRKVQT
eukprot:GILK01010455.1.p1 GENE.GILK01010455.1~~GILK01010455.1.p1  ORF type:complete len:193 (-),score=11.29 GILK01010455.1:955-1467(-)